MKQKEIWIVKYPDDAAGHEYKKERPGLIIESDQQIQKTNIFTVVPLTSNLSNVTADDILIKKDQENNLFANSVLKTHHIQSFDRSRFIKGIGKINENTLEKVKTYLKKHFDL
ncbi:MAG: type II toxin-antitoxin system PemK/MazF family toxin [Patescibacteria group bacterium]|nr:type II toxin-antitoxin system PemK/MazF family toxin [Patescibacteria group bacterium]